MVKTSHAAQPYKQLHNNLSRRTATTTRFSSVSSQIQTALSCYNNPIR